jgi:hypothetical protein
MTMGLAGLDGCHKNRDNPPLLLTWAASVTSPLTAAASFVRQGTDRMWDWFFTTGKNGDGKAPQGVH